MPMANYHHIGIQVRLFEEVGKEPQFSYPSVDETYRNYAGRLWQNSLGGSSGLNFSPVFHHSDYRERVDKDQLFLLKYNLNGLYDDKKLTGFDTQETEAVHHRV